MTKGHKTVTPTTTRRDTMDPHGKFIAPQTEDEFVERSKDITLPAAVSMLDALEKRREESVRNIDQEIAFYKKVIKKLDGAE